MIAAIPPSALVGGSPPFPTARWSIHTASYGSDRRMGLMTASPLSTLRPDGHNARSKLTIDYLVYNPSPKNLYAPWS